VPNEFSPNYRRHFPARRVRQLEPCDGTKCLNGEVCDATTGLCVQGSDGQSKNGSRLHVRVLKGEDGSQLPAGFFDIDAQRGVRRAARRRRHHQVHAVRRDAGELFQRRGVHGEPLRSCKTTDCVTPGYLAFPSRRAVPA
jgi:hypothetical protein